MIERIGYAFEQSRIDAFQPEYIVDIRSVAIYLRCKPRRRTSLPQQLFLYLLAYMHKKGRDICG